MAGKKKTIKGPWQKQTCNNWVSVSKKGTLLQTAMPWRDFSTYAEANAFIILHIYVVWLGQDSVSRQEALISLHSSAGLSGPSLFSYALKIPFLMAWLSSQNPEWAFRNLVVASLLFLNIILIWTLKVPDTTATDDTLKYLILFFRGNKAWHFMWTVCLADSSHEMISLLFSKE